MKRANAKSKLTSAPSKRYRRFNKAELVLPCGMFAEIKDYLFRDTSKEYARYLYAGTTSLARRFVYSVAFYSCPNRPNTNRTHW